MVTRAGRSTSIHTPGIERQPSSATSVSLARPRHLGVDERAHRALRLGPVDEDAVQDAELRRGEAGLAGVLDQPAHLRDLVADQRRRPPRRAGRSRAGRGRRTCARAPAPPRAGRAARGWVCSAVATVLESRRGEDPLTDRGRPRRCLWYNSSRVRTPMADRVQHPGSIPAATFGRRIRTGSPTAPGDLARRSAGRGTCRAPSRHRALGPSAIPAAVPFVRLGASQENQNP